MLASRFSIPTYKIATLAIKQNEMDRTSFCLSQGGHIQCLASKNLFWQVTSNFKVATTL